MLSLQPRVVLLHDFVGHSERTLIRNVSFSKLQRGRYARDEHDLGDLRPECSHQVRLEDVEYPLLERIGHRLSAATGLAFELGEDYEIAAYGPGRFSALKDQNGPGCGIGSGSSARWLATAILYLGGNSHAGGATAFPNFGLALNPGAGSALVYWNKSRPCSRGESTTKRRFECGSAGMETQHVICPVFSGFQWTATKRIRAL
ncbi:prolyl 4-hydroxylase subunit alpha-1-like isoform X2 [Haemaphysalis longicornis]